MLRIALNLCCFVVGLFAATAAFRPEYPDDRILQRKLEFLEEHSQDYDVVSVGSSRSIRAIAASTSSLAEASPVSTSAACAVASSF